MLESDRVNAASAGPASYRSLLGDLRDKIRTYVAKQILLPRQEVREIIRANLQAAMWLGGAVVFALLFLVAFVVLVVAVIAVWLPLWAAALVTMALFLVLTAIVGLVGYRKLELRGPERSVKSFRETVSWVRATLLGQTES
jgi:uncharacterized membrane protein YqjE